MIEVYIGKIPEKIEPELLRELLRHVSVEKSRKLPDLLSILVRSIICRKLQLKNSEINFSNNLYGKPHLCNATDFQFNVSHSGEWIACAVDKDQIGVDIEKIEPIDSISISERFFSSEEYNNLLIKNRNERLAYFYELWTMEESYIKVVGKGLAIPLHSVAVKRYRQNYMEIEEVNSHIQYY
ncbi:4'-phosphopantetheinyl transferase family protein [Viridibacillus sp. NPDC096237]|uniref:4'-phosphopantetheinyl transferase family protein n=1 Tax=Viridibacillus sp. NPDC096237 TaxID=3390721 RepID=UPI003CFE2507